MPMQTPPPAVVAPVVGSPAAPRNLCADPSRCTVVKMPAQGVGDEIMADQMLPVLCLGIGLKATTLPVRPDAEPAEEIRQKVWTGRNRLPGLCLEYAAYAFARAGDGDRGRRLFALGIVREAYDRLRCMPPTQRNYSSYADLHSVIQFMISSDGRGLKEERPQSMALIRAAARDPKTFDYPVDLSKVCDLSASKPETEWPKAQSDVQTEIEKQTAAVEAAPK